jgi:Arc/MetJ-type ribon-helix-helix transcriptional regulator
MTKKKTSISLNDGLLEWVQQKIEEKRFASVTHAIEYALEKLRKEEP